MISPWLSVTPFTAGALALGLAGLLLAKYSSSHFHRWVACSLAAAGMIQIGNGLGILDPGRALAWRRFALSSELALTVAILYVGLSLLKTGSSPAERSARWRARTVALIAFAFVAVTWSDATFFLGASQNGAFFIGLGTLGRAVYVFLILSLALAVAQAESILRATAEPLRYRLKFVLVGAGALAGYYIYEASQLLLLPVWQAEQVVVGSVATVVSVGLVTFGLARTRLRELSVQVMVSPQLLYGSLTFVVVGVYLLAVGLFAQMIRLSGRSYSVGLGTLVVFVAVVGLVLLLLSRAAKAELRNFISRHFYRSKYDYRAKWRDVTDAFRGFGSVDAIVDQLLELLSRTFGAGRISIWMRFEADGRFHQMRSANTEAVPEPLIVDHPVLARLMHSEDPIVVGPEREQRHEDPVAAFLDATRAVLCVPIRSGAELVGFVALSRERHGEYGTDDCDLLRAIMHHVGVLLSHARLAEERRAALELEALHRFSAFCLHDLKNLASRLSLVVQNAEVFGKDPVFQESAMKTVAGTVKQMTELITKLSVGSRERGTPVPVVIREVIDEVLCSMNGAFQASVSITDGVSPVSVVKAELHQILLNAFLNAKQAIQQRTDVTAGRPEVRISVDQIDKTVVVTISDDGPGVGANELRQIFQPFRTTKTGGLGIGLYESKRIIEENQGTISVESVRGTGTTVRIQLPAHVVPMRLSEKDGP